MFAGPLRIDSPSLALTDTARQAADYEREPRNKASAPQDELCLSCNELLVPSDTSPLERNVTGKPERITKTLRRIDRQLAFALTCLDRPFVPLTMSAATGRLPMTV